MDLAFKTCLLDKKKYNEKKESEERNDKNKNNEKSKNFEHNRNILFPGEELISSDYLKNYEENIIDDKSFSNTLDKTFINQTIRISAGSSFIDTYEEEEIGFIPKTQIIDNLQRAQKTEKKTTKIQKFIKKIYGKKTDILYL